jgi:hypothetical protein
MLLTERDVTSPSFPPAIDELGEEEREGGVAQINQKLMDFLWGVLYCTQQADRGFATSRRGWYYFSM